MRRLRRPGSRSSLSTERPSASRPTSDGARDSGGWRGTRRAREGTRAGAQPRARGRTRPEIDASAISNSPQSASSRDLGRPGVSTKPGQLHVRMKGYPGDLSYPKVSKSALYRSNT